MNYKILLLAISLVFVAAACNKKTAQQNEVSTGHAEIRITDTGFSPSEITVKQGTEVAFINDGSKSHWPASAPHPTHTDYSAFDSKKPVEPGSSWTFTFDQAGTWKFHDHLNPGQRGSVTVVE